MHTLEPADCCCYGPRLKLYGHQKSCPFYGLRDSGPTENEKRKRPRRSAEDVLRIDAEILSQYEDQVQEAVWKRRGWKPGPKRTVVERFWSKVDTSGDCWLWTGYTGGNGYGLFSIGAKRIPAHRMAYELEVGSIPLNMEMDHLCRNPACVRPLHLEPVTRRENLARSPLTFTGQNLAKTHCHMGHELNEENTYHWRGERHCRVCRASDARRYRQRNEDDARAEGLRRRGLTE